jgi:hypothetical protein
LPQRLLLKVYDLISSKNTLLSKETCPFVYQRFLAGF